MDRETFQVMWEMSGDDHEAEHCFLRIPQVENYCEARQGFNALEVMPDVSQSEFWNRAERVTFLFLLFSSVSQPRTKRTFSWVPEWGRVHNIDDR